MLKDFESKFLVHHWVVDAIDAGEATSAEGAANLEAAVDERTNCVTAIRRRARRTSAAGRSERFLEHLQDSTCVGDAPRRIESHQRWQQLPKGSRNLIWKSRQRSGIVGSGKRRAAAKERVRNATNPKD